MIVILAVDASYSERHGTAAHSWECISVHGRSHDTSPIYYVTTSLLAECLATRFAVVANWDNGAIKAKDTVVIWSDNSMCVELVNQVHRRRRILESEHGKQIAELLAFASTHNIHLIAKHVASHTTSPKLIPALNRRCDCRARAVVRGHSRDLKRTAKFRNRPSRETRHHSQPNHRIQKAKRLESSALQ